MASVSTTDEAAPPADEENKLSTASLVSSELFAFERYLEAVPHWPRSGQHILAQYSEDAILVYSAFNEDIGEYALTHQTFVGCPKYSTSRMTWIKTNFLWMMYRSGWGTKHNQTRVLGIWLKRDFFHQLLLHAKHTSVANKKPSGRAKVMKERGLAAAANSDDDEDDDEKSGSSGASLHCTNRLQWDPDHHPDGGPHVSRRAVQLGIKGRWHLQYISNDPQARPIKAIVDVTPFVREQRRRLQTMKGKRKARLLGELLVAKERLYSHTELPPEVAKHIQIDSVPEMKPLNP